jgi:hypothetical protein
MSRKKKVLIIIHLCFAFTYLFWQLCQPYLKEILSKKSELTLYEMVMERKPLFNQLPAQDQLFLLEGYETAHKKSPSFLAELGHLFFVDTPPFALAWLFFSLTICFLLLFHIEGATLATWLLPIIVCAHIYFLYDAPKQTRESLFPKEEYVLTTYVESSENKAMGEREKLLLGWHRYLVHEWAHEIESDDSELFKQQLEKGLFAFNVARLKWILEGRGDEVILAGFTTPPSLLRLACYFIWNLFFAWSINRKKFTSVAAQSTPIC